MPPRAKKAAPTNENATLAVSAKANVDVNAVMSERKVLAEKNTALENQIDELTKRLTEVELSKTQTEKKAKKFEAEVKTLKKTKGFTPSLEGIQVSKIEGDTKSVSKKDESKPKQPATAYLLYCNAHREQARAANPDVSFGDLTKVLSEMWKTVGEEEKSTLEASLNEGRARYQSEMVKYNKEQDIKKEEDKALEFLHSKQEQELAMQLLKQYQAFMKENQEGEDGAKSGKEVDPNKPKRSLTAFMFFSTETRKLKIDQGVPIAFAELSKLVGEEWNKLSAPKRKKYDKLAEADQLRYAGEMELYTLKKAAETEAAKAVEATRLTSDKVAAAKLMVEHKKEGEAMKLLKEHKKVEQASNKAVRDEKKAKKAARAGMPKRGATAYLLWCSANRANVKERHPEASFTDMTKLLAEAWKTISVEEKAVFKAHAEVDTRRFHTEMAAYKEENGESSSMIESGMSSVSGSVAGDEEVSSL